MQNTQKTFREIFEGKLKKSDFKDEYKEKDMGFKQAGVADKVQKYFQDNFKVTAWRLPSNSSNDPEGGYLTVDGKKFEIKDFSNIDAVIKQVNDYKG